MKEITGERKAFKDIFCMKKSAYPFLEKSGFFKPQSSIMAEKEEKKISDRIHVKDILFEDKDNSKSEVTPAEIIERQRYREIEESFNRELLKNAEKVTSLIRFFIISFSIFLVIDLFYWILAFTPFMRYMWTIGNICTVIQILSVAGFSAACIYGFITGKRITQKYYRAFETFDETFISEVEHLTC